MPLKIAFAMINCNRRDGSARAVNEVMERLVSRGHEVHLYARTAEDLRLAGIVWHRVPGPGWPEVADFLSYHWLVNAMLRRHSFDVVHSIGCNTIRANVATVQNVQPAKRRILARMAGDENISPLRRATRWLYLRVTSAAEKRLYNRTRPLLLLPVSRGTERELRAHYSIAGAAVQIIPNAADPEAFRPLPATERAAWRTEAGFQPQDVVAIFSGGEWARKGLDLAIRAVGKVSKTQLKLFVAGDDPDRARFEKLAATEAGEGRVIFGGFRKDIATAMGASDLFLFPSHYEAFSLATIEAAACGLPIVATAINGTEDFIQPGTTGEFVDTDPGMIAAVLDRLMADLPALRAMGEAARRSVEERLTWDRIADLTEKAYQSMAARPPSA